MSAWSIFVLALLCATPSIASLLCGNPITGALHFLGKVLHIDIILDLKKIFGLNLPNCNPPVICTNSRYRSYDGSCNNLEHPTWGQANTPYGKLISCKQYGDENGPTSTQKSGNPLPSSDLVSRKTFQDKQKYDCNFTLNTMQFGQLVAHDISFTAGLTQTDNNEQCCDYMFIKKNCKTNCTRNLSTKDQGCPDIVQQPITRVSGYLDLSVVYGNSVDENAAIREGSKGLLATVERDGKKWPPQNTNTTAACPLQAPTDPCYKCGDVRANQSPQLTIQQIIMLREHNRIAKELACYNPHWNDETLFQEARRILIAMYQHICFNEFFPVLIGKESMEKNNLIYPNNKCYVNDYNSKLDGSAIDDFSTASFRQLHSNIRGTLKLMAEDRSVTGDLRLSDVFNTPRVLEQNDAFLGLARGLTTQKQSKSDDDADKEITRFLFRGNNEFGGDLKATDITRARDHRLCPYNAARRFCNLPVFKTFDEMKGHIFDEHIEILRDLYETPDDVELVVGGAVEYRVKGSQFGPTFHCIQLYQYYRLRKADRFFYANGSDKNIAFTPGQLKEISKETMARILCDNTDGLKKMQPRAFELLSSTNQLEHCDNLPRMDLSLWKEKK